MAEAPQDGRYVLVDLPDAGPDVARWSADVGWSSHGLRVFPRAWAPIPADSCWPKEP
jgi:hypothetical protein